MLNDHHRRIILASQFWQGNVLDAYSGKPLNARRFFPTANRGYRYATDHVIPVSEFPEYEIDPTNMTAISFVYNSYVKSNNVARLHTLLEIARRGLWHPALERLSEKIEACQEQLKRSGNTGNFAVPFWWVKNKTLELWGYDHKTGKMKIAPEASYRMEWKVRFEYIRHAMQFVPEKSKQEIVKSLEYLEMI